MKKKFLPALCVIILISFLFINNSVFAANTVEPAGCFSENLLDLVYASEEYKSGNYYFVISRNDITYYKVMFIEKTDGIKCYIDNFGSSSSGCTINFSSKVNYIFYTADENPSSLKYYSKYYDTGDWLYHTDTGEFYANFDIYSDSTYTDFFFKAPALLVEALEATNPMKLFKKLMKNVVVSLVVFLVGFLTFSKAWGWLKTQLRKA